MESERQELEELGIYTHFGDDLQRAQALIVGPEGTPYENGFYFFDIQLPDTYPMTPPLVQFRTSDGRVRFNPNLYTEGKVCLSILGTWSGPPWTTSSTIRTVLVSIQSLLCDHPIRNEPGHETESGRNDEAYSEIIRYENIAVAVVRMLEHTPANFQVFRPTMQRVFLEKVEKYIETLEAYKGKEKKQVTAPIWNFKCSYAPSALKAKLEELRKKLQTEGSCQLSSDGATGGDILEKVEEPQELPAAKRARKSKGGGTS